MLPLLESDPRITLVFLCWRDIKSPKQGGAEVYTHEMLKRVDSSRYRVVHLSPLFSGASNDETIDGVRYFRAGSVLSLVHRARKFYMANSASIDFVVDQCNTHRFFTRFWVPANKRIFFIRQLTREIWHIRTKPPLSYLGAWTETFFLRLSRHDSTITVSDSTRDDLIAVGFQPDKVTVVPEGIDFAHWRPEEFLPKPEEPTFIYVGCFAAYKGIDDVVEAFGRLRRESGRGRLQIVGKTNEEYVRTKLAPIMNRYGLSWGGKDEDTDVTLCGFVPQEEKLERISRATALLAPSLREGWGLIVTEAAAVGTPSIVYRAPGSVDAVNYGRAGYLAKENSVEGLLTCMRNVINDPAGYKQMRRQAYEYSLQFHRDHTAEHFEAFMKRLLAASKPALPENGNKPIHSHA